MGYLYPFLLLRAGKGYKEGRGRQGGGQGKEKDKGKREAGKWEERRGEGNCRTDVKLLPTRVACGDDRQSACSYSLRVAGMAVSLRCSGVSASDARAFHVANITARPSATHQWAAADRPTESVVANITMLMAKLSHVISCDNSDLHGRATTHTDHT